MPISPNQGPEYGNSVTVITGVNLANAIEVKFGTKNAVITANTPTSITVLSPSGSGCVAVTVRTSAATSNPLNYFYIGFPIVSNLDNNSGNSSGGNTVVINGYNLSTASSVDFGGNSATPTIISDSQISVVAPAGSQGTVYISVTTQGGTSSGISYNYVDPPTFSSITPSSGFTAGGTSATLFGTNLATTTNVTFAGVPAAFAVINSTTVAVITPPGTAGLCDIVIETTGGSATGVDAYTYVNGPGI